jgi:hypothetical protein
VRPDLGLDSMATWAIGQTDPRWPRIDHHAIADAHPTRSAVSGAAAKRGPHPYRLGSSGEPPPGSRMASMPDLLKRTGIASVAGIGGSALSLRVRSRLLRPERPVAAPDQCSAGNRQPSLCQLRIKDERPDVKGGTWSCNHGASGRLRYVLRSHNHLATCRRLTAISAPSTSERGVCDSAQRQA